MHKGLQVRKVDTGGERGGPGALPGNRLSLLPGSGDISAVRGARLPRQISAQEIVCEITDVSPCGKCTICQARCALHLSEIQGPASGLEHQWTSRGDAGPAGVERSSFRVPLSTHTSTHHPQGLGHLPFTPGDPLFPAAWDHPRTPSVLDKPGWLVTRLIY